MNRSLLMGLADSLDRSVSAKQRSRARMHLLDWLACIAGGLRTGEAEIARKVASESWEKATYLGNVLEMDDVHRIGRLHPGPVVWPASMSVKMASLEQRLDAAVRGYEAMVAIGSALDDHHYAHWHPTATVGVFGACASAGSLLGLSPAEYGDALGNAGSVAGGLWHMRHDDVRTKQWHIFHAVRTGLAAARHAKLGVNGPHEVLEGPQGLFAAMTREPGSLARKRDGWLIEEVSFKPFAACRHAHPAIDVALELRGAGQLEAPILVETYRDAMIFCDRPDPQSEADARFSIQHAVAVVASGRQAAPEDFTMQAVVSLAGLRSQVSVREDPAITARYPEHFGARINGFEIVDTLGDPERPIGMRELVEKARNLIRWGGLPDGEAERATTLALEGDDAAAIDAMLEEWLQ